jgi:hypothetical protein
MTAFMTNRLPVQVTGPDMDNQNGIDGRRLLQQHSNALKALVRNRHIRSARNTPSSPQSQSTVCSSSSPISPSWLVRRPEEHCVLGQAQEAATKLTSTTAASAIEPGARQVRCVRAGAA